jgi:hypothetical protein
MSPEEQKERYVTQAHEDLHHALEQIGNVQERMDRFDPVTARYLGEWLDSFPLTRVTPYEARSDQWGHERKTEEKGTLVLKKAKAAEPAACTEF